MRKFIDIRTFVAVLKITNMDKEIIERLQEIVNKPESELTREDKDLITTLSSNHGIAIKSKRCLSCYIDAAVELYRILTAESNQGDGVKRAIRYRLKDGVKVTYNGEEVNEETMTDEKAEELLRRGFPIIFFDLIYEDED